MTTKKKTPGKAKPKKAVKKPVDKKPGKKAARKPVKKAPVPKKAPKKAQKKPAKEAPGVKAAPVYEHVFDNPKNVKRAIHILFAVCGVVLILDYFVARYVDHPWEGVFGFYALYGFAACVVLVLVAKELRKVLMRGEDYYDG